jgi:hypothetical protein
MAAITTLFDEENLPGQTPLSLQEIAVTLPKYNENVKAFLSSLKEAAPT